MCGHMWKLHLLKRTCAAPLAVQAAFSCSPSHDHTNTSTCSPLSDHSDTQSNVTNEDMQASSTAEYKLSPTETLELIAKLNEMTNFLETFNSDMNAIKESMDFSSVK